MKRYFLLSAVILALPTVALPAGAKDYSFPINMKVTIERGETPIMKSKSSVVFPIVNKFSVTMPNGYMDFVLETESGEEIRMVADGSEYLLQTPIALGEEVFFGVDTQTVGKPIRVLVDGPITLGHVHFASSSSRLNEEAKFILDEMAQQMYSSGLFSATLVGMTDIAGDTISNLGLSLRRANMAAKYLKSALMELGVEDPNIVVENMGEYLSSVDKKSINPYDRKVFVTVYPKV